jgi:hypothetical protein
MSRQRWLFSSRDPRARACDCGLANLPPLSCCAKPLGGSLSPLVFASERELQLGSMTGVARFGASGGAFTREHGSERAEVRALQLFAVVTEVTAMEASEERRFVDE